MIAAYDIFTWKDGTLSTSGWGLFLLFVLVLGISSRGRWMD